MSSVQEWPPSCIWPASLCAYVARQKALRRRTWWAAQTELTSAWCKHPAAVVVACASGAEANLAARPACSIVGRALIWRCADDLAILRSIAGGDFEAGAGGSWAGPEAGGRIRGFGQPALPDEGQIRGGHRVVDPGHRAERRRGTRAGLGGAKPGKWIYPSLFVSVILVWAPAPRRPRAFHGTAAVGPTGRIPMFADRANA